MKKWLGGLCLCLGVSAGLLFTGVATVSAAEVEAVDLEVIDSSIAVTEPPSLMTVSTSAVDSSDQEEAFELESGILPEEEQNLDTIEESTSLSDTAPVETTVPVDGIDGANNADPVETTAAAETPAEAAEVTIKRENLAPVPAQVKAKVISPSNPLMAGETITFGADVTGMGPNLSYRYTLKRSNGAVVRVMTDATFTWRFFNPATYYVDVEVNDGTGTVTDTLTVVIGAQKPVVEAIVLNPGTTVKQYETVNFNALVRGVTDTATFSMVGTRPDGSTFTMSSDKSVQWSFNSLGQFSVTFRASDKGSVDTKVQSFTVVANPMVIEAVNISQNPVMTFEKVTGSARIVGGPANKELRVDLIRPNGTRLKLSSSSSFTWQFYTPGDYKVEFIAKDGFGNQVTNQLPLTVAENKLVVLDLTAKNTVNSDIQVYDPLRFNVETRGGIGKLSYTYQLFRADGSLIRTVNAPSLDWNFFTPATYRVRVTVRDSRADVIPGSSNQVSIKEDTFAIAANPLVVRSYEASTNNLKVWEKAKFVAAVTGGYGKRTYTFELMRANGSRYTLYSGEKPFAQHFFYSPADYRINLTVTDAAGNKVTDSKIFTVAPNPATITAIVNPGPTSILYAGTLNRFGLSIEGGGVGGKRGYKTYLVRNNGAKVFMGANRNYIPWTVQSSNIVTYRIEYTDFAGNLYIVNTPLDVRTKPANAPKISSFLANKDSLIEDRNSAVTFTTSATGATPLQYSYYVSHKGAPEVLMTEFTGAVANMVLNAPGRYEIRVRATDGNGVYTDAFTAIYTSRNLPVIQSASANTSNWSSTKKIPVVVSMVSGSGKNPLRYVYRTYSWKNGVRDVLVSANNNVELAINDADVAGLQVIAIDARGNRDRYYLKFNLPGAWSGTDANALNISSSSGVVNISWSDTRKPSGYIIFADGEYVGQTSDKSFSTGAINPDNSPLIEVVAYITMSGKSFYDSPESQRITYKPFDPKKVKNRYVPYSLQELRRLPLRTRELVVDIATRVEGLIPYYWDDAYYPGFEGNNFGAPAPPDQMNRTKRGMNCSGFVEWVFWTAGYDELKGPFDWTGTIWQYTYAISKSQLRPGDLGLLEYAGHNFNHVGIYAGNGWWAHSSGATPYNVVDTSDYWKYFRRPYVFGD